MKNSNWIILTLVLLLGTGLQAYSQISLDLVEKAKAAIGITDGQIPAELLQGKDQNSLLPLLEEPKVPLRTDRMETEENEILENIRQQQELNKVGDLKSLVFGREIFSTHNLTFAPDLNAPTPKNYRLAAGDELLIDVWGDSELNLECVISPEGMIVIPNLGPVSLTGLTVEEAERRIKHALSRIMSSLAPGEEDGNTFVSVNLGKIRSIKVNIVGEAMAPGTYLLPSFATLFNALYAAGGVNDIGSLRNIKLYRNSKEIVALDVYDYLFRGQFLSNLRLEDNDMIIIEPYEQLVTVTGKVKRNRTFEVKENETLQDVLRMAGGFTGDAYRTDVRVRRKTGRQLQIATVRSDRFGEFLMHDGDTLVVDSVIPFYENRVMIAGAVWRPGEYELSPEVGTVKQLIEMANGLKGDEFMGRAHIDRLNPDFTRSVFAVDIKGILNNIVPDVALQKEDVLTIPSLFDLREAYTIKVSGAVNRPDTVLPFSYNMTVEDAIIKAGGLSEAAAVINVEVARRIKNPGSSHTTNIIAEQFNLTISEDLSIRNGDPVFTLEPFDEVYVRFSPGYSKQQVVKVHGEISFAGNYVLSEKNSRLSDLVFKAGGVTPDAYVKGASLKRLITEDELRRIEAMLSLNNKSEKDSVDLSSIEFKRYSVGIDLEKALTKPDSFHDLVLRDGDELYIPQHQSTVKISGSVTYPNSITFMKNISLKECLSQAGGYDENARKYPIVVYMNGKVSTTKKRFLHKKYPKIEPGCEIIVPLKTPKASRALQDMLAITSSTTSIAAMLTTMINTFK